MTSRVRSTAWSPTQRTGVDSEGWVDENQTAGVLVVQLRIDDASRRKELIDVGTPLAGEKLRTLIFGTISRSHCSVC
jgi:dihydroorotase-like cyclic amidohydrolase